MEDCDPLWLRGRGEIIEPDSGSAAFRRVAPQSPRQSVREYEEETLSIDTAEGSSYILTAPEVLSPPPSDHLRFPMCWVHLKVPHRGLPRA